KKEEAFQVRWEGNWKRSGKEGEWEGEGVEIYWGRGGGDLVGRRHEVVAEGEIEKVRDMMMSRHDWVEC
ncbi:hypothetical protein ACH5RR_015662, partial [Cinchona calisaya]